MNVAIVKYNAGNIYSVVNALKRMGIDPVLTDDAELLKKAEKSVFALHPEIGAIKQRLYDMGAVYASMSGSGSSLYGLFREPVSLDSFNDEGTFKTIIPLS